ncbi:C-C motif chemokine 17-like isoform X2 [Mauremys mutica]|uniref:C-C motif chemokine 17-like isoform X2 n=1 Tax=Mauremys mutica TaxID=74926 RepID=UPI001D16BE66|nr:C-C motif chemokine 17-like isoform X2 [Mauremys mutica]
MISLRTALLAAFLLGLSYQYATVKPRLPMECCFVYMTGAIQLDKLVDFYWTPSECNLQAVVLETVSGRKVCADPSKVWVKRAIKVLQAKRKQTPRSEKHR